MNQENYLKFPKELREKLQNGETHFSSRAQVHYEPITAFRGIRRKKEDLTPVTVMDFQSYAQMDIAAGKFPRRGMNPNNIEYYGVSLFLTKESVENALKFPRKNKKIAVGNVYEEVGPSELCEATGHVSWWLYEGVDINGFSIYEDEQNE
jgi:hypothetical protein